MSTLLAPWRCLQHLMFDAALAIGLAIEDWYWAGDEDE